MSECVVRMEIPKGCWDCPCVNGEYGYCQADKEERQIEDPNGRPSWCPIIAASPWHRVEEPPKKHGKYPVCWVENGNFYWEEAHYCYYQDGDKWIAWSSFQGDDVEITPDYWMPIEPPKEDE